MAALAPAPRHIFLTGAPDASSLSWESSGLAAEFSPQLKRYLVGPAPERGEQLVVKRQDHSLPTWRLLPLARQHLETGLTPASPAEEDDDERWAQEHLSFHIPGKEEDTSFLTTSDLSFGEDQEHSGQGNTLAQAEDEALSQFYEHSFALHEAALSGGTSVTKEAFGSIGTHEQHFGSSVFTTTSRSFDSNSLDGDTSFNTTTSPPRPIPALPAAAKAALTHNLDDIPNAAYLHSISPQTMAVNLIVGILEIKPPRLIRIRRGTGKEMEIVEMLVGDETRSGFGINFWLWPERRSSAARKLGQRQQQSHNESESLRDILNKLRPQDIILARNVALSSFRGQVYGQFLRMELARLYLLYRSPTNQFSGGDYGEETSCIYRPSELLCKEGFPEDPQTRKVRKVRDWVIHFVAGPAPEIAQQGKGKEAPTRARSTQLRWGIAGNHSAMMPPDTPL
jgi:hypothetical protein